MKFVGMILILIAVGLLLTQFRAFGTYKKVSQRDVEDGTSFFIVLFRLFYCYIIGMAVLQLWTGFQFMVNQNLGTDILVDSSLSQLILGAVLGVLVLVYQLINRKWGSLYKFDILAHEKILSIASSGRQAIVVQVLLVLFDYLLAVLVSVVITKIILQVF